MFSFIYHVVKQFELNTYNNTRSESGMDAQFFCNQFCTFYITLSDATKKLNVGSNNSKEEDMSFFDPGAEAQAGMVTGIIITLSFFVMVALSFYFYMRAIRKYIFYHSFAVL